MRAAGGGSGGVLRRQFDNQQGGGARQFCYILVAVTDAGSGDICNACTVLNGFKVVMIILQNM